MQATSDSSGDTKLGQLKYVAKINKIFTQNNWFTSYDEEAVAKNCVQVVSLVFFFVVAGLLAI